MQRCKVPSLPLALVAIAVSHPRPRPSASSLLRSTNERADVDDIIFSESSNKNCLAPPSPLSPVL